MANNYWENSIKKTFTDYSLDYRPIAHQWKNSEWIARSLKKSEGVIIGDSVGTGKTFSALFGSLLYYVRNVANKKYKGTSILIVCPNKDLISKWKRDIYQISTSKPCLIDYVGNITKSKHQKKIIGRLYELLDEDNIDNLDNIQQRGYVKNLIKEAKHKIIFATNFTIKQYFSGKKNPVKEKLKQIVQIAIIDEAHKLRQKSYQDIIDVSGGFLPKSKKILLTATPFQKDAGELKKLMKVIGKENDANKFIKYRHSIEEQGISKEVRDTKNKLQKEYKKYITVTNNSPYKVKVYVNNKYYDQHNFDDIFYELEKQYKEIDQFYYDYLKERMKAKSLGEMVIYQKLSLILSKPLKNNAESHPKIDILKAILTNHFQINPSTKNKYCCKPVIFAGMNVGDRKKGLHQYLKEIVGKLYEEQIKSYKILTASPRLPDFDKIIKKISKEYFIMPSPIKRELHSYAKEISSGLEQSKLYRLYSAKSTMIKKIFTERFDRVSRKYVECILIMKYYNKNKLDELCETIDLSFIDLDEFNDDYDNLFKYLSLKKKHLRNIFRSMIPGKQLVDTYSSKKSMSEKKNMLNEFQNPLEPFALIVSNAGSEGLDMQNYTKGCIHYDMAWSPGVMIQRNGRINRIGKQCAKRQAVQNHYLVIPNTYDERIFSALQKRMTALNLLVPIDIESKELFMDIDHKNAKKIAFNLERK